MNEVAALDDATRGSFVLANAARQAGVERFILASTLDIFDRFPSHWQINEVWRPRPTPDISQLSPWLGELSVRENTRLGPFQSICLRFGEIVDDAHASNNVFDARWVHIDDVVHAIGCALRYQPHITPAWSVFHIMAPGPYAKLKLQYAVSAAADFGYKPTHDFQTYWPSAPSADAVRDKRTWREIPCATANTLATAPSRRHLWCGGSNGCCYHPRAIVFLYITCNRPATHHRHRGRSKTPITRCTLADSTR